MAIVLQLTEDSPAQRMTNACAAPEQIPTSSFRFRQVY